MHTPGTLDSSAQPMLGRAVCGAPLVPPNGGIRRLREPH